MTKVKICGLMRSEDADILNRYRPDFAGAIMSPGFSRSIGHEQARAIRERLDRAIPLVGVFVDADAAEIAAYAEEGVIAVAQLHGKEDAALIEDIKHRCGIEVWKAFQIGPASDWEAIEVCPADLVVLDAGKGSGQTFDWSLASHIVRPFILAGGLTPQNVTRAIGQVHPYGVDVSSGVEEHGQKDDEKVRTFIEQARLS